MSKVSNMGKVTLRTKRENEIHLKIKRETHEMLLKVISKLQLEKGRRVTVDEAIRDLIALSGIERSSEIMEKLAELIKERKE